MLQSPYGFGAIEILLQFHVEHTDHTTWQLLKSLFGTESNKPKTYVHVARQLNWLTHCRGNIHYHHHTMKSPAFETTSLLYVTPTDSTSMQEWLMQEHKQKLCKTCSRCGRDTWYIESKQILQHPNYLIIIVNRITYSNNRITINKCRMPLDLYIKLCPYKFSLQAYVDHHGYSMNSGHYTASINSCGNKFHCNDTKITECNITDTFNSSTAYILLYKLMEC